MSPEREVVIALIDTLDKDNDADFKAVFKAAIKLPGLTDVDFADAVGVSLTTIERYVNGKNLAHSVMRKGIVAKVGKLILDKVE